MEFQKVKAEQSRIANANANSSINPEYSDKIKSS